MAAILKFKKAAKITTSNFPSAFIAIHILTNMEIATILSSLGNSEAEIVQNMLKMAAILKSKMAAILKFKMASKWTTTRNFPSALIISLSIINLGFATICSSLGSSEVEI